VGATKTWFLWVREDLSQMKREMGKPAESKVRYLSYAALTPNSHTVSLYLTFVIQTSNSLSMDTPLQFITAPCVTQKQPFHVIIHQKNSFRRGKADAENLPTYLASYVDQLDLKLGTF
jgi:hypothetical protein